MSEKDALTEYRINRMEETQGEIVKTVNQIDNKVHEQVTSFEVLKTRVGLYASALALAMSIVVSIATNYVNTKMNSYTESEKSAYHEMRVSNSKTVAELREELKKQQEAAKKQQEVIDLLTAELGSRE